MNLDLWAWHVIDVVQREAARQPNDRLQALVRELETFVPERPRSADPGYLGFAVPLRLRCEEGELRLMTTLARFGTAVDVTVAELRLEAFLPADEPRGPSAFPRRPSRRRRPPAPRAPRPTPAR